MYSHISHIRVRYGETDKMGYLYYGNYAQYYEVARVEAIRSLGLSYKEMEDTGVMLPVLDLEVKYIKPAHYDELLSVEARITRLPDVRIYFEYEIKNYKDEIINIGKTTLVFFDNNKRKPVMAPIHLLEALKPYFS